MILSRQELKGSLICSIGGTCKDITDIRTKKLLYITRVRSRLEYANVVWSAYTKRNITSFEQILGKEYPEHDRLSKLNLLPLQYRREIYDLVFFFKCFKNMYYLDILDFVSFRSCNKPLGTTLSTGTLHNV